jgi:rhodanese-related sulfurtransferase
MKLNLIAILVVCCVCAVAEESVATAKFTSKGHTTDSLTVVKESIKANKAVLIDVREQGEWDAGHLKSAKLIPMSLFQDEKLTKEMRKHLSKDKPIYLHCKSGGRVLRVSKLLKSKGYDVRPLLAGYSTLIDEGFEKAPEKRP